MTSEDGTRIATCLFGDHSYECRCRHKTGEGDHIVHQRAECRKRCVLCHGPRVASRMARHYREPLRLHHSLLLPSPHPLSEACCDALTARHNAGLPGTLRRLRGGSGLPSTRQSTRPAVQASRPSTLTEYGLPASPEGRT